MAFSVPVASESVELSSSPFCRLDEIVTRPDSFGVIRISAEPRAFAAIGRHIARRAGARMVVRVGDAPTAEPWRELARRLDVTFDAHSGMTGAGHPLEVASRIVRAATGSVLVVAEHHVTPWPTTWGAAVADEVARSSADPERRLLLVLVQRHEERRRGGPRPRSIAADTKAVDAELELGNLTAADLDRWWSAVLAHDAFIAQPQWARLSVLDRWWQHTRTAPSTREDRGFALDSGAERLLGLLAAAAQALSPEQLLALGAAEPAPRLLEAGVAVSDIAGALSLADGVAAPTLDATDAVRLAEVLAEPPRADGWSTMRAAELLASAGRELESEAKAFHALRMLGDALARRDLWDRWESTLAISSSSSVERLIRSAEHALELGDAERAEGMVRTALRLAPDRPAVLLLHGRASYARGDLTAATVSLTRALAAANATERARVAGVLAEVRYAAGDLKAAAEQADEAIASGDADTRLDARNVHGKLLLARESWNEAEEHFAGDALEAAGQGALTAELRAQLNRAIAIMCLGRLDEARGLLEDVLETGERHGIMSAAAFALSNLAAVAIVQHRYDHALALSERAIEVRRMLGGRIGLVEPITVLAELRLRLGLIDEAEQGLRFGMRACAETVPLSRQGHFARVAAMILLERGRTGEAATEVASAIAMASTSGDRGIIAQCHRLEAEIALEDGDVARARAALERAAGMRHTAFGQAELAVLKARLARASGADFRDAAHDAIALAQTADDPESLRVAHWLLAAALRQEGDSASAAMHLDAARAQRDRVALALPVSLRERYLARRGLRALDELELEPHDLPDEAPATVPSRLAQTLQTTGPRPDVAPPGARRLVGDSPAMRALRATIARVAEMEATVLVSGPTGTGKELAAEAIHRGSPRRHGPLVKVNCAALVETLLLSELFGHEKGAFTGASARRRGRFELAEGGTLFLDEIGDISPRTQVALLRVLQDGTYERVGGTTQLKANVRIVCATHRDLKAMVARGEFREDLYYRLCGVVLEVPALRDRLEDLPVLAATLLAQIGATSGIAPKPLSADALRLLGRHTWPGNVRELENALRVAALFAQRAEIQASDLLEHVEGLRGLALERAPLDRVSERPPASAPSGPGSIPGATSSGFALSGDHLAPDSAPFDRASFDGGPPSSSSDLVYAEIRGGTKLADMKRRIEQECITRALLDAGGNITRAATLLGMKRPRLSQLVKQYDLGTMVEEIKA